MKLIRQQRLVDTFYSLVQIDSESTHEREMCDTLKAMLSDIGLQVEEDDTAKTTGHGSGNLFAWLPATEGLEEVDPIYFTCHMDTVSPGKGIKPRLDDDGYIRSDGTTILGSDDKAGIAAIIEALRSLQESRVPHGPVQIVITVGEELGLVGAKAIDPERIRAKYGFALDSDGKVGEIAIAAPAQTKIEVIVYGKAAHAGVNPEDGISAIQVASAAISRMRLGRIDHETTANIGSFHGGTATNIVCDAVTIRAEARSIDNDKLHRQVEAMREAFVQTAEHFHARVDFQHHMSYPGYELDEKDKVVQVALKALESIGRSVRMFRSGGGSDANILNGKGIPTVNLATGYERIHSTEEQMPVTELVKLAEAVLAIIRQVCEGERLEAEGEAQAHSTSRGDGA